MLAAALCETDPEEARSLLQTLVRRVPESQDAWVALLAIRVVLKESVAAAEDLSALLRFLRPPNTRAFHKLADEIVRLVAAPGWCGMDAAGRLVVSPGSAEISSALDVELDGKPVEDLLFEPWQDVLVGEGPGQWRTSDILAVSYQSRPFLGSGMPLLGRQESTGFVEYRAGQGLVGQAWLPADPDAFPILTLQLDCGRDQPGRSLPIGMAAHPSRHETGQTGFRFVVPEASFAASQRVRVLTEAGRDLWGSPLSPHGEQVSARLAARALADAFPLAARDTGTPAQADLWRPLYVRPEGVKSTPTRRRRSRPGRRNCDVIIPVHNGFEDLRRCLQSLPTALPAWARIVVVDDGSTDIQLRQWIDGHAQSGGIVLVRHPIRRGFPSSVNTGMALAMQDTGRDVVLLNSDTVVPLGWLEKLSAAAYASADIGSVTPLTNDGSIVSSAETKSLGELDESGRVTALDQLCGAANPGQVVDIPTAVGFCMYIKRACLEETGGFRDDVFAQGYGEENDWCMRARTFGWRHVAAADVFVAHSGGRSFGVAKAFLTKRNGEILNRLHPGYASLVEDASARNSLRVAWRAIHQLRWLQAYANRPVVLLVSHGKGGGVQRYVQERCLEFEKASVQALILSPSENDSGQLRCELSDFAGAVSPLHYDMPGDIGVLAAFLRAFRVQALEIHHLLGQAPEITDLAEMLGVPMSVYIHDYGYWCPRFNLVGAGSQYCGEPSDVADCDNCIADLGSPIARLGSVADYRARSQKLLETARAVVVPSNDVQGRFRRHFPSVRTAMRPWAQDSGIKARASRPKTSNGASHKIVIVGAIGQEKGFEVVLACARDAARRNLPLEFCIVGFTIDDRRLLGTGKAFISGRYEEKDVQRLIGACRGDIGFVPSVCPETWCFALTALLEAGLNVMSFDIGTQAERIWGMKRGFVMPLGTPTARINDFLLAQFTGATV